MTKNFNENGIRKETQRRPVDSRYVDLGRTKEIINTGTQQQAGLESGRKIPSGLLQKAQQMVVEGSDLMGINKDI